MTETLYIIDITTISLFFVSYYRNCYRRGYRIDIWHLLLFQVCVLANQIMAPFAASDANVVSLENRWEGAREHIGEAFVVSMVGYAAVLAGGWLWERRRRSNGGDPRGGALDFFPRQSQLLMAYPRLLAVQAIGCAILQAWILSLYFRKEGFGFDLRLYTFEYPSLRPFANIISNYSMIIGSHCFARYLAVKDVSSLRYALLLSGGLLFFGSRTEVLLVFFMPLVCYFIALRQRLPLLRLIGGGALLVIIFTFAEGLREGYYQNIPPSGVAIVLLFKILYGNTFSDLRDFALVMSGWDGHFWLGRTYLAALMGFIPRTLSTFRDTWSLGVMTTTMVGFDPDLHPGLRPGFFGESYFNFGYMGVVMMGLFIGTIVRKVDFHVKRELGRSEPSLMRAFSYTLLLTVMTVAALSGGMATLFVMIAVFGISGFCRRAFSFARSPV